MSSIHGQKPGTGSHAAPSDGDEAPRKAPQTPPASPRPAAREQVDAVITGPRRPAMVSHTQSERLQRPTNAPVPSSPPPRHVQTTPAAAASRTTAADQQGTAHVAAFSALRGPFAALDSAGVALARQLGQLVHHPEGLKAYFYSPNHPGLPPMFASHTDVDAASFASWHEPRAAASRVGHPEASNARLSAAPTIAEHRQMNRAVVAVAKQADAASLPEGVTAVKFAAQVFTAGIRAKKALPAAVAGGAASMQGGTRLTRAGNGQTVQVEPSGQFGYADGGEEATEALANFYANVLVAQARATRSTPPEVVPQVQRQDHGELTAESMNAGLVALAARINAKVVAAG